MTPERARFWVTLLIVLGVAIQIAAVIFGEAEKWTLAPIAGAGAFILRSAWAKEKRSGRSG